MISSIDTRLDAYAELVVKVGANVQPDQRLLVIAPTSTAAFVHKIVVHAYKAGAPMVEVLWIDERLRLLRLQHAAPHTFATKSHWFPDAVNKAVDRGDALLSISAEIPDLLTNQDHEAIALIRKTEGQLLDHFLKSVSRNAVNWTLIAASIAPWAEKVYPTLPPDEQTDALWSTLFRLCRLDTPDPVASWQQHIDDLRMRSAYLTGKQYTALHYTGPGTDLMVGLPDGHIWHGGRSVSEAGIPFVANLPTEEVFTMPHKCRVDGVVTATKPLNLNGVLVDGITLQFAAGNVVDATARQGSDVLRKLLETDDDARRLGEVALVPHSSPISQSGALFYNTLLDENASCHFALGSSYTFTLRDGDTIDKQAFAAAGGNLSIVHVDFMIGSETMDIDGACADGSTEPVMRAGEWVFSV